MGFNTSLHSVPGVYEEALAIKRTILPAGHPDIASGLNNLANIFAELRRFNDAFTYHKKALIIRQASLPINHTDIATSLMNIGNVLYELRRFDEALTCHEEALGMRGPPKSGG